MPFFDILNILVRIVVGRKSVTLFMHFTQLHQIQEFQRVQMGSSEQIGEKFCIRRDATCG